MAKEKEGEALSPQQEKMKALQAAMLKIEKDFGKGSIMRMGEEKIENVEVIPTGSIDASTFPRSRPRRSSGNRALAKSKMARFLRAFFVFRRAENFSRAMFFDEKNYFFPLKDFGAMPSLAIL